MVEDLSRTTILIGKNLWKKFKIKAIEESRSASELLSSLIKKYLGEK